MPRYSDLRGMCYNVLAVNGMEQSKQAAQERLETAKLPKAEPIEDACRYCPVCSQRLESKRCKLVCHVCGYYMSCADYY